MIVVTGAAGFIGSRLLEALRDKEIVAIEDAETLAGERLARLVGHEVVDWRQSIAWLEENRAQIEHVFHLGGESSTTAPFADHYEKNLRYTVRLWQWCAGHDVPLIYASSAATYGDGSKGFSDKTHPGDLKPLNGYGLSKNAVDLFAYRAVDRPPHWYALKFFNVYGPGEQHKGAQRSMASQLFDQARDTRSMTLFKDGRQRRDFVYVDDCVYVMLWLAKKWPKSGVYNVGTGRSVSFIELAETVSRHARRGGAPIKFVDMPRNIASKFQAFTQADISKLRAAGYLSPFRSIAEGAEDYFGEAAYQGATA